VAVNRPSQWSKMQTVLEQSQETYGFQGTFEHTTRHIGVLWLEETH